MEDSVRAWLRGINLSAHEAPGRSSLSATAKDWHWRPTMKRSILAAIALMMSGLSQGFAENLQPVLTTPEPIAATSGSPGTATPTPYPQVTPPSVPRAGGQGNPPLLPKIPQPGPPKEDEPLPGLPPPAKPSP